MAGGKEARKGQFYERGTDIWLIIFLVAPIPAIWWSTESFLAVVIATIALAILGFIWLVANVRKAKN